MSLTEIKRLAVRTAVELGQAERLLGFHWDRTFDLDVDPRITSFEGSCDRGVVVLPLLKGIDVTTGWVYGVLAHAFRTRGYQPLVLQCQADLDLCHGKQPDGLRSDDTVACTVCQHHFDAVMDEFGLETVSLRNILPDDYEQPRLGEDITQVDHQGVPVGSYARSSARKYLKKYHLDFDASRDRRVYERYLRSAMLLADVGAELFSEDVAAIVGHHPTYVNGGVLLHAAANEGIPAATFDLAYRDGTIIFGNWENPSPLPQFTDSAAINRALEQPLDDTERSQVEDVLDSFADGTGFRIDVVGNAEASQTTADCRTIGLFTNLIWDASLEADGRELYGPFTWFSQTIDYVAGRDDLELIIKTHPAEAVFGSNESVSGWIRDRYDPFPTNVTILPPDTDVSPYELIKDLNAGVVYNSTIGLEMACRGIPAIVTGETHYRDLGFTFDPETSEEYFELLDDDSLEMTDAMRDRALRYAHFFFVNKHLEFPFYKSEGTIESERLPVSHDQIASDDSTLELIVNRIVANEAVVSGINQ